MIRRHRKAALGSAAGVAVVVGAKAVPGLGDWLDAHPLVQVASTVGLVALFVVFWLYLVMDDAIVDQQNRVKAISSELMSARHEKEAAQAALREAETQLTPHDRDLFNRWLDIFPSGSGIRLLLRRFYPRSWRIDFAQEIENFVDEWIDRAFVDPELQTAYREFYEAAGQFSEWLGDEGHVHDKNPDLIYRPKPQREQQFDKWYANGRCGAGLAEAMANRATDFEQMGHTHGL